MNKKSNLVILPDNILKTKPSFKEFIARYPVEVKGQIAILYKAVHKKDGRYFSDNNISSNFEYVVGETKEHDNAPVENGSCSFGLHIAEKRWALLFGVNWDDMALLECEVPIKNIVVCKDTDGKLRTSKLKVLREVPRSEW